MAPNTFNTDVLNTVVTNEIVGAVLSSNTITLPVGSYYFDAIVPFALQLSANQSALFKPRLFNFTTSLSLMDGHGILKQEISNATIASYFQGTVSLRGRFTLGSTSVLILQHFNSGGAVSIQGVSAGLETYSDICIWKIS